jgi:hypothetical protein
VENIEQNRLTNINVRFNEEADRYQETEGQKRFVKFEEIKRRLALLEQSSNASTLDDAAPTESKSESPVSVAEPISNEKELSLLQGILNNLKNVNDSFKNIINMFSEQKEETDADADADADADKEDDEEKIGKEAGKKSSSGLRTKLLKTLGFTLFAVAPLLIDMVKKNTEKIKAFFDPIFTFVKEDIPYFFTETLPSFFMEDIPTFFKDKFSDIKFKLEDIIRDIQRTFLEIKRSVGETIISIGKYISDKGFTTLGKRIQDFGQGLTSESDKSLKALDDEEKKAKEEKQKADISAKKEKKQKKDERLYKKLKYVAEKYAEEKIKNQPIESSNPYKSYKIVLDKPTNTAYIDWTYQDGKTQRDEKSFNEDTLDARLGVGDLLKMTPGGYVASKLYDNYTDEKSKSNESAASPVGSINGGVDGGAVMAGNFEPPEAGLSGQAITDGTNSTTDPILDVVKPTAPAEGIQIINQKRPTIKPGTPWDITNVPSPSIVYNPVLANQLFYSKT